jgi:hypothetical protein
MSRLGTSACRYKKCSEGTSRHLILRQTLMGASLSEVLRRAVPSGVRLAAPMVPVMGIGGAGWAMALGSNL